MRVWANIYMAREDVQVGKGKVQLGRDFEYKDFLERK